MKYVDKIVKTLRIKIKDVAGKFGELAMAIGKEGGLLGDIIKVRVNSHYVIRDVTIYVDDAEHLDKVLSHIRRIDGIRLIEITDEVLKLHEGGKITMKSKITLNTISEKWTTATFISCLVLPGTGQLMLGKKKIGITGWKQIIYPHHPAYLC